MTSPDSITKISPTIVASGASRPRAEMAVHRPRRRPRWRRRLVLFPTQREWRGKGRTITTPESKTGRISLIVTAAGNLAPTNQVIVGSELSGTAKEVYVDTNDPVKKGQPLAKLDTSKLDQQTERSRAALLAAKARVSQAEATLAESKAALARQEELHDLSGGKTPSRATMETSRATVARAEADLESAKAAVAGAEAEVRAFERDLEKAIIRSPVDGIVLARSIEVGQTVAASFTAPTLFTIAEDLKKMELLVAVSEADIGRVEAGQTATFSVDAWPSRTYTAKVKKVAFGAVGTGTTAKATAPPRPPARGHLQHRTGSRQRRPLAAPRHDRHRGYRHRGQAGHPRRAQRRPALRSRGRRRHRQAGRNQAHPRPKPLARRRQALARHTRRPKPAPSDTDPEVWTLKDGEPVGNRGHHRHHRRPLHRNHRRRTRRRTLPSSSASSHAKTE